MVPGAAGAATFPPDAPVAAFGNEPAPQRQEQSHCPAELSVPEPATIPPGAPTAGFDVEADFED